MLVTVDSDSAHLGFELAHLSDWIVHRPEAGDCGNVDVRLITENGVERRKTDELEALLDGPGLLWIDVAH